MAQGEFISSFLRPGHPDFLDLPWNVPVSEWEGKCPRLEQLPRGLSRHPVVFVNYQNVIYAVKEVPKGMAEKEYEVLKQMSEMGLPVVTPVGHVRKRGEGGEEDGALITIYLNHSVPYYSLFMQKSLARYREHLLDAMASLLVQLHLAGVYWGDCSLSNTLFRRDAGALQAYFVDAETSEVQPALSDGMRRHDLEIMEENLKGGLMDLAAMAVLPPGYSIQKTGAYLLLSYQRLWNEITREEIIAPDERYKIRERVRKLNDLGFSVDEVSLLPQERGEKLRMRAFVTDRNFHRDLLDTMTGVHAGERQARQMVNEIREFKASISRAQQRSFPLSVAAYRWLNEIYMPALEKLKPAIDRRTDLPELYCQVLEHKWYLSEKAKRDVGHGAAVEDFLKILTSKKEQHAAPEGQVRSRPSVPPPAA